MRYNKKPYRALLLLILTQIIDCIDGQVARKCNKQTKLGGYLDLICDNLRLTICILLFIIIVLKIKIKNELFVFIIIYFLFGLSMNFIFDDISGHIIHKTNFIHNIIKLMMDNSFAVIIFIWLVLYLGNIKYYNS